MIDVLEGEIEFVFVPLRVAAILAAAIGQHAQQLDIVFLKDWYDLIIEQIRGRDWRLAII